MQRRRLDRAAIEAEVDRIRSLGLEALRKHWRSTFGARPPAGLTKNIVARMICYRLQEEAFGGLDRETIRLLDSLARGRKSDEMNRRLKPGTVLLREYDGARHTVTVAAGGFVWRGTTYSSLSTIARAITGTAWNGPRFFGLRDNAKSDRKTEPKHLPTKSMSPAQHRGLAQASNKTSHREVR
jgi:hypothetical protein